MRNQFSGLFHARDKPRAHNAVSGALGFFFGSSSAGRVVNERSALQTTVVYACVRVIACKTVAI